MRHLHDNLLSAWRALGEHWLRSLLTGLGVTIGVASVELLVGIGLGVQTDVSRQIESLGTNTVIVVPGKLDRSGMPNPISTLGISPLTDQDVTDLAAIHGVHLCAPLMFVFGTVERKGRSYSAVVVGSTAAVFAIRPRPLQDGHAFAATEEGQAVCVLSHGPKVDMFGSGTALGQAVSVRGVPFRVVGVLAPEEASILGQGGFSDVVYIPAAAARRSFRGGQVNRIVIQTDYRVPPDPVLAAIRSRLLANHAGAEDFGILTQRQMLGALYKVSTIVNALLVGISAISLIVAGIGIMNIMLVTVTERSREIGIRKAVGARRRDVFAQFLTEAVLLSFSGGVVGTGVAAGVCGVLAAYTALKPILTTSAILEAFGVCFAVGVVFGVGPAVRAARLDPIEALRRE